MKQLYFLFLFAVVPAWAQTPTAPAAPPVSTPAPAATHAPPPPPAPPPVMAPAVPAATSSLGLSCTKEALDQCRDAKFQLAPIQNDEFSKMFEVRRLKFIDWMKPAAMYIQGVTGLPASVFIAQAGVSSDWGGSPAFRNNNNIFKHMCWVPNSTISGEIMMNGQKFTYKGSCGTDKTFGSVGRPYKFATREESVLAYLHMVMFSQNRYYKNFQEELKRGNKHVPPRQASFRGVAGVLTAFSHDSKYVSQLQTSILAEKISVFDIQDCWQCLLQQAGGAK